MATYLLKFSWIFLLVACARAAIVPEELPSLLSVAYSNIPPIKKGTDSRVGFGFALGNHADFQVVFELGPQTNTNPIGTSYASSSKRHVSNASNKKANNQRNKPTAAEANANEYLSSWSQNMKQKKRRPTAGSGSSTGKPNYSPLPIPDESQPEQNPHGAVNLLELLTKMANGQMANGQQKNPSEGPVALKQPDPTNMPTSAVNQLKRLYGQDVKDDDDKKEQQNGGVIEESRPKFVPRRPAATKPKRVVSNGPQFERLAHFNVDEGAKSEAEKRKVTAELSDVSLDDDE